MTCLCPSILQQVAAIFQENKQSVQGFLKPRLGPCTSAKVSLLLHFTDWSKPQRQSKFREHGNRFFLSMEGDAQSEFKGLEWKEWRMETIFPPFCHTRMLPLVVHVFSPGESNPCRDVSLTPYPMMSSYIVFYKIWFVFCRIEDYTIFILSFPLRDRKSPSSAWHNLVKGIWMRGSGRGCSLSTQTNPLLLFLLTVLGLHWSAWALCGSSQVCLVAVRRLSCPTTCGILVPWPGICIPWVARHIPYHWATKEVPSF